jgi:putative heme-binding domain-containing protein
MPGWKDVLSEEAVWAITAYVMSLSSEPPSGAAAIVEVGTALRSPARPDLSAKAMHGKDLFFDLTRERRCSVCHEVDGLGTSIGPNLKIVAKGKTTQELERDILEPDGRIAYGFEQVQVELDSGETIAGVLAEETETRIRIFDAASMPPPLRSVRKAEVKRQQTRQRSSMPDDLDSVYTSDEIAAIATYLSETAGGSSGPG